VPTTPNRRLRAFPMCPHGNPAARRCPICSRLRRARWRAKQTPQQKRDRQNAYNAAHRDRVNAQQNERRGRQMAIAFRLTAHVAGALHRAGLTITNHLQPKCWWIDPYGFLHADDQRSAEQVILDHEQKEAQKKGSHIEPARHR